MCDRPILGKKAMNLRKDISLYGVLVLLLLGIGCSGDDEVCVCGPGVFVSPVEGGAIEGELFLPEGTGPFPAIIIVPGSGLESRETDRPFAPIFNSIGSAVYIYDKRGVGNSTGSYPVETSDGTEFLTARAEDILAIIETLKQHDDIDASKIGLLGGSQGTWVNAIVYDRQPEDVDHMVMISGGAVPTGWEQYFDNLLLDHPDLTVEAGHDSLAVYQGNLGFDSRSIFEGMTIPVLFVLGGKDRSHPTLWEVDFVEELNKPNFEIHFYENATHDLIDESTGQFPEDLLPRTSQWVQEIVNN